MNPTALAFATIKDLRAALERGELSTEELVKAQLERAHALSELNAFITLCEGEALSEARARDAERRAGGALGPLHGVPVTAKDLVWSRGVRTTSGSKLREHFVPARDAAALERLRSAGAVLLGKTNLHEFAYGVSNVNPHYGPARNPWNRTRISGGSSGGSAVSLAAGVGYGSIGTDTGGSIRIPSALCGTVGLKPTYGAVPRDGVTPLSWSLDHVGPMARTVEDVAVLFAALSDSQLPDLEPGPLSDLRLGLHEKYFFEGLSSDVERAVRGALGVLDGLGMEGVPVDIPEIELQGACRNTIAFAEASSYHEADIRRRPELYGEDTRELLRLGLLVSAADYIAALRARGAIVQAFARAFESFDVLAAPATPSPAPAVGEGTLDNGEELRSGLLRLASPFNTTGFPAISLPCGRASDGRPVGLQLAARPGAEGLLLRVARAFEAAVAGEDWSTRRPAV